MFVFSVLLASLACALSSAPGGLQYSQESIDKYGSSSSWAYINRFVTPYLFPKLDDSEGKKVLDIGCGVGLWSFYAAKQGASVYGIDVQEGMIEIAKELSRSENIEKKITFTVGDATAIEYPDAFFDTAISVNVACNLSVQGVEKHFSELRRVLNAKGEAVFIAPTSLDKIFTNGQKSQRTIIEEIHAVLEEVESDPTLETIQEALKPLDDVLSATFFVKEGRLTLLTEEVRLDEGHLIYRKLPNLTLPNRYYTEKTYLKWIQKNQLEIEKHLRPRFESEEQRKIYNATVCKKSALGPEYLEASPFVIFHLKIT